MAKCVNGTNTSTFTYGSDGIRHSNVVNGNATDFVLDASMFVRELHNGIVKATYFMGANGPAYRRDDGNGGTVRWYLYDGLGSVLGEVDPNGNITARRKYDVYGMTRAGSDAGTSKHKFVGSLGHPSEDETSLIYMRARYYDPQIGRFVSEDSAKSGVNWYIYCNDNPVNAVDPTGHVSIGEIVKAIFDFLDILLSAIALALLIAKHLLRGFIGRIVHELCRRLDNYGLSLILGAGGLRSEAALLEPAGLAANAAGNYSLEADIRAKQFELTSRAGLQEITGYLLRIAATLIDDNFGEITSPGGDKITQ